MYVCIYANESKSMPVDLIEKNSVGVAITIPTNHNIYIYIYMFIYCTCVCIYIYIYVSICQWIWIAIATPTPIMASLKGLCGGAHHNPKRLECVCIYSL